MINPFLVISILSWSISFTISFALGTDIYKKYSWTEIILYTLLFNTILYIIVILFVFSVYYVYGVYYNQYEESSSTEV